MMRCIRSPWWDGLLLWSGLPIGLGLASLYALDQRAALVWAFTLFLALDAAHLLSPLALTVAYVPLRDRALREPGKFIAVPAVLLLLPTFFWGKLGSWAGLGLLVSGVWNYWHFSSQGFGIIRIYRRLWDKPGLRWLDRAICAVLCVVLLPPLTLMLSILGIPYPEWLLPIALAPYRMPAYAFLIVIGVLNVNHWLTALSLSTLVMSRSYWLWLVVLVLLGASGYLWAHPFPGGGRYHGLAVLAYMNFGVGFAHFWVDGLIWKRGSPAMREVIT